MTSIHTVSILPGIHRRLNSYHVRRERELQCWCTLFFGRRDLVGPDEFGGVNDERELLLDVLLCDGVALGM